MENKNNSNFFYKFKNQNKESTLKQAEIEGIWGKDYKNKTLIFFSAISRKKLFSTNSFRKTCFTIKWKKSRKKNFLTLSRKSLKNFLNADFFLMDS